jgi:hypothetical protein
LRPVRKKRAFIGQIQFFGALLRGLKNGGDFSHDDSFCRSKYDLVGRNDMLGIIEAYLHNRNE